MTHADSRTYPPLNTLKPVAPDVWVVDGPLIRFGLPFFKMTFPTRMTIVRIGVALFIHSPTAITEQLRRKIAAAGKPAWIIGPNRIHYWWIPDWRTTFPEAGVFLAPRIKAQSAGRIDFASEALDRASGYPWDDAIRTLPVEGDYMTEVVFFHRASRTLILTDLIENFEPHKIGLFERVLIRLGGASDPDGSMPRDMRMTYTRHHRARLCGAIETMIGWAPERTIAHGRWYDHDATNELKRAFRWLLD